MTNDQVHQIVLTDVATCRTYVLQQRAQLVFGKHRILPTDVEKETVQVVDKDRACDVRGDGLVHVLLEAHRRFARVAAEEKDKRSREEETEETSVSVSMKIEN